jgi:hypothetical protein
MCVYMPIYIARVHRRSLLLYVMHMCVNDQMLLFMLLLPFSLFISWFYSAESLKVGAGCIMCQILIWWLVRSARSSRLNKNGRQGGTCSWKGLSLSLKKLERDSVSTSSLYSMLFDGEVATRLFTIFNWSCTVKWIFAQSWVSFFLFHYSISPTSSNIFGSYNLM